MGELGVCNDETDPYATPQESPTKGGDEQPDQRDNHRLAQLLFDAGKYYLRQSKTHKLLLKKIIFFCL